jgi:hypothetical protein
VHRRFKKSAAKFKEFCMDKKKTIIGSRFQELNRETAHNCTVISQQPKFDSPHCEARFRRALRNVPSKAYIKREEMKAVLCVRPYNLLELGASVNREGLEQCHATRKILRYLDKNKEECLKFEHYSKN